MFNFAGNQLQSMKYLTIITILCFLVMGCTNRKTQDKLEHIEQLISQEDTAALPTLDSLGSHMALLSRSDRMRYELLRAEAYNKFFLPMDKDTVMKDVADYYVNHGSREEKMRALYMLGCVYRDKGEAPRAIEYYNRAVEVTDTNDAQCNYTLLCRIYAQMAGLYEEQNVPQQELKMWPKAIRYAWLAKDTLAALSYMNHSMGAYYLLNQKEKAYEINRQVYLLYKKYGYEREAAACVIGMIEDETNRKQLGEAKRHIDEYRNNSGFFDKKGKIERGRALFYHYEGKYYEATGQSDSALQSFHTLLQYPEAPVNLEAAYRGLMTAYQRKGMTDSVAKYAQLFADANDSANIKRSGAELIRSNALYNYNESQREATIHKEKNRRLWITLCALGILLLAVGGAVMIGFRRIREKEVRKDMAVNERYSTLLYQYTHASNELKDLYANLEKYKAEKERDITKMQEELSHFQVTSKYIDAGNTEQALLSHHIVIKLHELARHAKPACQTDWEGLQLLVSSQLSNFYDQITRGGLTKQELRVCILTRLSFIPSEIATLLDAKKQRVTNIRTAINQKLFHGEGTAGLDECIHTL